MAYEREREALTAFYHGELTARAARIKERVYERMNAFADENPTASVYCLKATLYRTIAEEIEPQVFAGIPFCFETGALVAHSDGKFNRGALHANGWLYERQKPYVIASDPELYRRYAGEMGTFYPQTGLYVDMMHAGLPFARLFRLGLSGILCELDGKQAAETDGERIDFLSMCRAGIAALLTIAARFAECAEATGMPALAEVARRVPAAPPATYHEGLFTLAFLRKALGAIEGVGFSTFGRVDVLLAELYERDLARGVSNEEMLDDTARFMLAFDCALNTFKKIDKPYEFDLENSLTLGGCDREGREVFNGVTRLFFRARAEHGFLYPKMMFRYSAASSDEYLAMISSPLLEGKSYSLFENDDITIPALVRSGIALNEARDYAVGGCWDVLIPDVFHKFSGEYLNILRLFEYAVHGDTARFEGFGLPDPHLEAAVDFEDFYHRFLGAVRCLAGRKAEAISCGSRLWHELNPMGALSALMQPCMDACRDLTAGGGRYNWESLYFCGFSEIVDSLIAVRRLCFEGDMPLCDLLAAVQGEWQNEALRNTVIGLPSYGDGSPESTAMAARLFDDLYKITRDLPTAYGGEWRIGYNQFTEVIFWGKTTRALPNGRRLGDYICQGLTPSRLQRGYGVTELLDSLRDMDLTACAGNASMTVTLPACGMDSGRLVAFLRMAARAGAMAIQPNCVDKATLLAAQRDPESYRHIIVRVCGFSAPFVLLSEEYQAEILSRVYSGGTV